MAHQNIEAYEDKIYCQLPEGIEGWGGYRPDILVDNLSEREINLFICRVCNGIKRESCFKEHRDRPDSLVNTEEIRQEIGNIKVSCPLNKAQCKWIGKLSEFEIHINNCVERGEEPIVYSMDKVLRSQLHICCSTLLSCLISFLCCYFLFLIFLCFIKMLENQYVDQGVRNQEFYDGIFNIYGHIEKMEVNIGLQSSLVKDLLPELSRQLMFQLLKLHQLEQDFIRFQDKVTQIGDNLEKSKESSSLNSIFIDSFRELQESFQKIRLNPYSPQKGVIWNIYHVNDLFLKPTESSGPEFYVNEYKFQPMVDTTRDNQACVTFCIALVNCNHYDKIKWPMELEVKAFKVFIQTYNNSSETLSFELNEDNKYYFEKPKNEKNKPLCKQWLCKSKLMKYVENDGLTIYILNTKETQSDPP